MLNFLKTRFGNRDKLFLKDIRSKNFIASSGPKYVVIDITNRCNMNCIACWTYSPLIKNKTKKSWFKQELSYEVIQNLIKDLKKLGTKEIRLTGGGEPFMHPHIMSIIKIIKKNYLKLDITTNFTLLNKEKIDLLMKNKIENLTVSLWAASPETYIKTHPNRKKTAFEKIKQNLRYLNNNKKNTRVVIANVISNLNYHEISKMVELAYETGSDEVYFTLVDPIQGATDSLLLSRDQQNALIKEFKEILANYEKGKYGNLNIDNPDNFLRRIENKNIIKGLYDSNIIYDMPCTVGWTFSRIMANGDVAPCCRAVMIPSGNLNKNSFKEIWNSDEQKRFRKIGLDLRANPEFVKNTGCLKTCDNIMENKENYSLIRDAEK